MYISFNQTFFKQDNAAYIYIYIYIYMLLYPWFEKSNGEFASSHINALALLKKRPPPVADKKYVKSYT